MPDYPSRIAKPRVRRAGTEQATFTGYVLLTRVFGLEAGYKEQAGGVSNPAGFVIGEIGERRPLREGRQQGEI